MTEPKIQQLYEDFSMPTSSSSIPNSTTAPMLASAVNPSSMATMPSSSATSTTHSTATTSIPFSSTALYSGFGSTQTSAGLGLPSIDDRPNSAARRSHIVSAPLNRLSRIDSARAKLKQELPLTPVQALEKYSRHLTPYEQEEIMTYGQIWFVGAKAKKIQASVSKPNNNGYDDDKGRYKCIKHDHIGYRFEIMRGLGKGSFGDVVETFDHKTKQPQAVKIIRNERRFHRQAQIEIKILEQLKRSDRKGTHHVVHLNEYFMFRNHLCITFDLMHQDLYNALKKDGFKGFTLTQVNKFCKSLLSCLRLLRRQKIIHCDLKPENILLTEKNNDDITVIDFGSACFEHQKIHSYIQSRFYRAPEVILSTGYSIAIDMWSLGCILAELYTGHPIFPGRDEKEQLMFQMEVLGLPPDHVLHSSKRGSVFFHSDGSPRVTTDRKGRVHLPGTKSLSKALGTDDHVFLDFIQRCFDWDPQTRMTPKEASRHPWIAEPAAHNALDSALASDTRKSSASSVATDVAENMTKLKIIPNTDQFHEVTIPSEPQPATSTGSSALSRKPTLHHKPSQPVNQEQRTSMDATAMSSTRPGAPTSSTTSTTTTTTTPASITRVGSVNATGAPQGAPRIRPAWQSVKLQPIDKKTKSLDV
eukprot:m.81234 g.81234  ORF g.81234 m.81234 type:complete len:643 (+) comp14240_c1_seq1:420-2348(+)